MESIPATFWMFIIFALSTGLFLILFYIAMAIKESISLIKETTGVLHEVKDVVKEAKDIVVDAKVVTGSLKGIVAKVDGVIGSINDSIIAPIVSIGGALSGVAGFLGAGKNPKDSEK